MDDIIRAGIDALSALGFDVHVYPGVDPFADGALSLSRDGHRARMTIEAKERLTLSVAQTQLDRLYLTDYVSPKTGDSLRRRGIQYVDTAGNAFINTDRWLIDVRGRKPPARARADKYATENLYSPKRAQVIFALISWPELLDAPLRQLAECAGVSLGIAQSTRAMLSEREALLSSAVDRDRIIEGWAATFPSGLAPRLQLGHVRAEQMDRFFGEGIQVSGELAIPEEIRPSSGVIYLRELTADVMIANRWRRDRSANLIVRRSFWKAPHESSSQNHAAPWLIVYADLLASSDPRARGAAGLVRSRV